MASQRAKPTCANCRHWERYLASLGECLEYVTRREAAFAASTDTVAFHTAWPRRAAADTDATYSCDRHQPAKAGA